jgi:hypothetical protein
LGGQKAIGTPDVDAFNAQMALYRPEVAKILTNPNLAGVLTVESMRDVKEFLYGNMSQASLKAVVNLLESDFGTRKGTLLEEIKDTKDRMEDPDYEDVPDKPGASGQGAAKPQGAGTANTQQAIGPDGKMHTLTLKNGKWEDENGRPIQ